MNHAAPSAHPAPSPASAAEPNRDEVRPDGRRLAVALVAAVVTAVAAGNLAASTASWIAPAWAADLSRLAPVVILVVYAAVIAVLLLVLGRTARQRRGLLAVRPVGLRAVGYGVAVWTGAYLVAGLVYLVSGALGGSGLRDAVDLLMAVGADNGRLGARLDTASVAGVAVILVRIVVLSPVAEELLFRGALYTWMRSRLPAGWTILLTGVGFGLIHQSPAFLPLAVVVGLAAGWIRERTGSVVVPIVVHSLQSSLIVLVSLAATSWHTPALLG